MKKWTSLALVCTWALYYVNAISMEQRASPSAQDVCSLLSSLSVEGQMFSQFNGIFFGDFKAGKNAGSQGPLAIGGSFTGQDAFINQRNQLSCSVDTASESFSHHGLILKGSNESPIRVNGHAYVQLPADKTASQQITTPLHACSVKSEITKFDFDLARASAMTMSRRLAGMLPNWSIGKMGVIVNIISEGIHVDQPYHLFTMPINCATGACHAKNYFACSNNHECETPAQVLSDAYAMLLGKTDNWSGPSEQSFPNDKMVVINIPVLDGHTFDIKTKTPSEGLNACNTIYNFYAVNQEGKYDPKGKFNLVRSSNTVLSGMLLAPQGHIIDNAAGSFAGQIIADSYESTAEGVQIHDYKSAGHDQCQAFSGCDAAYAKRSALGNLVRRQNSIAAVIKSPIQQQTTLVSPGTIRLFIFISDYPGSVPPLPVSTIAMILMNLNSHMTHLVHFQLLLK